VKCWGDNSEGQTTVPDLQYEGAIRTWADTLTFYSYKDRKVFFNRLTQIQSSISDHSLQSKEEILLLFLTGGFITKSSSEFFTLKVTPSLDRAKSWFKSADNISSSADIAKTPERVIIALRVLEASLSASKSLTTADVDARVAKFIADTNTLIAEQASAEEAKKLINDIFQDQKIMAQYREEESLWTYLAVFEDVRAWFN